MMKKRKRNIEKLLNQNPKLKEEKNYRLAVWEYWALFEKARYGVSKEAWLKHLTMPEDIIQTIKQIKKEDEILDSDF